MEKFIAIFLAVVSTLTLGLIAFFLYAAVEGSKRRNSKEDEHE